MPEYVKDRGISRRALLKGAGAIGALYALSPSSAPASQERMKTFLLLKPKNSF